MSMNHTQRRIQAYAYGGYRALYESGRITEAACMAHARRKIHDVHERAPTDVTTEALQRVGELYAIEAEIRGCTAEQHLAARKARAAPLMQSLYDWIQTQMKTLSRHSDTAKVFAYLLKQWDSLNVYCSNGWVEINNNIAENALRGVAVDTVTTCKFFPGPVSRIVGMPDTAPSGAVVSSLPRFLRRYRIMP